MKGSIIATFLSLSIAVGASSSFAATRGSGIPAEFPNGRLFKGKVNYQLTKAENLMMSRHYDDAAKIFRAQLRRDRRNVDALAGLGMVLALQFKLDAADEQFEKALFLSPSNPAAHVGKAMAGLNRLQSSSQTMINQRESTLQRAEEEARLAVQNDPTMPLAHYTLGMVLKEQGKNSDAFNEFQQAVTTDPQFSAGYSGMGMIQLAENRIDEASTNFRRAILLNSSNSTAHYGLGEVLLQQNSLDAAIKELNTALYQFRNSAPVHMSLGKAYEAQGNNLAALKYYERAALIKPELKEAYTRQANLHIALGKQLLAQNNTVGALKEYRQAQLIDPYNPEPYLKTADMRESRGDLELAIAEMRSGLELNPNEPSLRYRVAENLLKLDKLDDAIREFQSVLSNNPANSAAVNGLTRALYLKAQKDTQGAFAFSNDYEKAVDTLDRAIKLHPEDMQLRLAAAKIRAMSGAPVDLSKVGQPTNDPERIAYAEALLATNKFDESAQQMRDVISHTTAPEQLFAVADLALMIKDYDSAKAAYDKARSAGSHDRAARGLASVGKSVEEARRNATLGADLAKRKQLASAVDNFRLAIAGNPRLSSARYDLAEAEQRLSPKSPEALRDAATQYRAYLSLNPNLIPKQRERVTKKIQSVETRATKLEQRLAIAAKKT